MAAPAIAATSVPTLAAARPAPQLPGPAATEDEIIETAKAPTGKILKRHLRDPYWAERDAAV